ncbi:hypothetical protein HYW74_00015 [Candidatus Pacearchaeota archaeon]|nr:hypothetical protein [Candidatus Pacearchaeota archaeon]
MKKRVEKKEAISNKSIKNKKLITILIILLAIILIASAIIIYLQKTNIITGKVIEPLNVRITGESVQQTLCPDGQTINSYSYSCDSTLFNNQCPAGSNIASDKYCSENNRICCKTRVSGGGTNPQNPCPQGCLECRADGTCVYADPNDCFPACPQGQVCNRIGRPACYPRECNENSDCRQSSDGRQLVCDGGLCVYCKTDADCREGETCRQSDKRCVSPQPTPTNTECSGNIIENSITYSLSCSGTTRCINGEKINGRTGCGTVGLFFPRPKACCKIPILQPTEPTCPAGFAKSTADGTCEIPQDCPSDMQKCQLNKKAGFACCKKTAICGETNYGKDQSNWCNENENSCDKDTEILCKGNYANICCPKATTIDCGKYGFIIGIAYCKNNLNCNKKTPGYCMEGYCCDIGSDGKENTADDKEQCVKFYNVVGTKYLYSECQPITKESCKDGETYCPGILENKKRERCCPVRTQCKVMGNGYPYCYSPSV